MAHDFTWMLAMHGIAQKFGDGLKPELVDLLKDRQNQQAGVTRLEVTLRSSGPAHQEGSTQDFADPKIATLQQPVLHSKPRRSKTP